MSLYYSNAAHHSQFYWASRQHMVGIFGSSGTLGPPSAGSDMFALSVSADAASYIYLARTLVGGCFDNADMCPSSNFYGTVSLSIQGKRTQALRDAGSCIIVLLKAHVDLHQTNLCLECVFSVVLPLIFGFFQSWHPRGEVRGCNCMRNCSSALSKFMNLAFDLCRRYKTFCPSGSA